MAKKAFITGASRGIGRGIAQVLSEEGYDIAFTYNSKKEEAEALASELKQNGSNAYFFQASTEISGVAEDVTKKAIDALEGIDLLVCNAGRTIHNSLLTVSEEKIDYIYNLNYRSYIMCSKVAANYMVKNNIQGNIIFISSTRGLRAYPEDCLYGGLKAALQRSCESMALEMAKYKIRVNTIAPGNTAVRGEPLTGSDFQNRIPLGRSGSPKEIGYLVSYLASDKAAYITGDTIKIDGGLILPGMPE